MGGVPPPSRRRIKIATPRIQNNPAGIHLTSARTCSDNRGQLCLRRHNANAVSERFICRRASERGALHERLKSLDLIVAGPRAPEPGAPYAYVTTRKFLEVFGLVPGIIDQRNMA
jgi:hypothetical protein